MASCFKCPQQRHRQDSSWSWMVCWTATLADGLHFSLSHCFAVVLPVLVKEFNETRENAAWVGSVAYALTYLVAPLSVLCCKHIGCRWTTFIGSLTCAVGLGTSSLASTIHMLYFTYSILLGVGGCFIHISGMLLVQRYFKRKRSLATGIVASGSSFGAMLGPLYQLLLDTFDWKTLYRLVASFFIVPLLLVTLFYSPNVDDGSHDDTVVTRNQRTNVETTTRIKRWKGRLNKACSYWNPEYCIAVMTITLQSFGIFTPLFHLVKHTNEIGLPTQKASMLFIYIGITSLLGKIMAGYICDFPRISVFWVQQTAGIIAGLSIIFLRFPSNEKGFITFACFYGLGLGTFFTPYYLVLLNTVTPEQRPSALATGEVISGIAALVGPPFIGFIADKLGSYVTPFAVSGGIVIAGSLLPFFRICVKSKNATEEERQSVLLDEYENQEKLFLEKETVL